MFKEFSTELRSTILQSIDDYQSKNPGPHYAAFDADGTLWDSDVGEAFFDYLIDEVQLPVLQKIDDPWKHYRDLKKEHPPKGYLWLAQICAGYTVEEVRSWALKCAQQSPPRSFPSQLELVKELKSRDIEVYVVSASVEWSVEGALEQSAFESLKALGVNTKVVEGKVTADQGGPVTWQTGKAEALLEKTNGIKPLFAAGNSNGDIHLLEISQTTPLCLQTQTKPNSLFDQEQILLEMAKERNWHTHAFN